jgi:hypothetical protein
VFVDQSIAADAAGFLRRAVRVNETLKFTAITAGGADHTCALTIDGDTYCWASNQYQQLGSAVLTETCSNGTLACSSAPVRLEDAPRFTALAASIWADGPVEARIGAVIFEPDPMGAYAAEFAAILETSLSTSAAAKRLGVQNVPSVAWLKRIGNSPPPQNLWAVFGLAKPGLCTLCPRGACL